MLVLLVNAHLFYDATLLIAISDVLNQVSGYWETLNFKASNKFIFTYKISFHIK